ncbi:ABC transporter substrate-binding protein, partial [Geobacter sp. SVR]|uniref:ABC transporter substrate-binding protein n=1 Tax=Geobacter sp. SVR TaxID=2495594 RepID=UPI0015661230
AEVDVERIVREDRPGLVLAIGDSALSAARRIRQTPVVAVMAFGLYTGQAAPYNLTGISMFATPERYVGMLQTMKVRRVGIIHNHDRTGWYLRQARQAAEKVGLELVVREVKNSRETLAQLDVLSGKVDALWMLPDLTAVSRENAEAFFRFGQENAVPVISFASSYLGLGAAAVVDIDRSELGRQAADTVMSLLNGGRIGEVPFVYPRTTSIKTNPNVLKRLGHPIEMARPLSTRE